MKMKINILILCAFLFHVALSAPSDKSLVVSSTESSKEGGKDDVANTSPTLPVIYEMDITANISNRFAKALVVSKVKNPDQVAKEATFTVVLPEKAFISEFVMEIGGKSYKAYVKEKEEAKNIYDQAVAHGQSAAHVSASARDSNRFTVSVNIEPEAKAVFLLTYEELLERKNEQYELVLNIHPGQLVNNLKVEVHINESRPLKFVRTPSLRSGNEISKNEDKLDPSSDIQIDSTKSVVKFTPDSEKQKQFAKELGTKESDGLSGQFVVQYDVEHSQGGEILLEDGYFVHFFAPKNLEPLPKHVVFVLDTSGSMGGRKLERLKDAMYSILKELKKEDILSIVEFNSDIHVWGIESENSSSVNYDVAENYQEPFDKLNKLNLPSPSPANPKNIEKAKNVIRRFFAGGGTHIIGGLESALYLIKRKQEEDVNKSDNFQPIIIFLTDGEANGGIYDTNEINKIVTRLNFENNKVPIFTLSFGYGADKEFLRKVSLKNLGFSRHIYEAADASLQLQEFYRQISSPLLNNIDFKYTADVERVTKARYPTYFAGSELVVAGRYTGDAPSVIVSCFGPRGPIELTPIVEKPVTSLERLWAYLTVKQILDERDSADNKTELTKKALDLSLQYSFVTDVSSLVVVKPNETSVVDTEDAATGPSQPHPSRIGVLYSNPPPPQLPVAPLYYGPPPPQSPLYYGPSQPASSMGVYPSNPQPLPPLYSYPQPLPPLHSYPQPQPKYYDSKPIMGSTIRPFSVKERLENALPWLTSVLNPNETLSLSQGSFELGDEFLLTSNTDCPKTPLNTSDTGTCTPLKDCPEVYSYLTDLQVYQRYFCPIENRYAGVCCPDFMR